jgi:hypothetical protein
MNYFERGNKFTNFLRLYDAMIELLTTDTAEIVQTQSNKSLIGD